MRVGRKSGFTLVSVLITVVVLAALLTLASPLYLNAIESAKAKVCATNLKALKMAVEVYGVQEGALPGSLSQLRPQDLKKAWAKLFKQDNPWLIKLAYFLVDLDKRGVAYAANTSFRRFGGFDLKTLTCPDDDTPPSFSEDGSIINPSYGLNAKLVKADGKGISWKEYESRDPNIWVVADCNNTVCSTPIKRHKKHSIGGTMTVYAQYIKKNNFLDKKIEVIQGNFWSIWGNVAQFFTGGQLHMGQHHENQHLGNQHPGVWHPEVLHQEESQQQ